MWIVCIHLEIRCRVGRFKRLGENKPKLLCFTTLFFVLTINLKKNYTFFWISPASSPEICHPPSTTISENYFKNRMKKSQTTKVQAKPSPYIQLLLARLQYIIIYNTRVYCISSVRLYPYIYIYIRGPPGIANCGYCVQGSGGVGRG